MSERAPIDFLPLDHPEVLAMKEADARRWAEEDVARAERLKLGGGPAFPSIEFASSDAGSFGTTYGGISIRDYFAAQAMQNLAGWFGRDGLSAPDPARTAKLAYQYVDAMLAAREEQ